MTSSVRSRIDRLSQASLRRIIEPDVELPGTVGAGPVLPDELLSVAGLDLKLTPDQKVALSRAELASITEANIRFEAALMAAFTARIAVGTEVVDPRVTYLLHEIGEETRHSRLFLRMLEQLGATARNPLQRPVLDRLMLKAVLTRDVVIDVVVLAGEEMTDLQQKRASEHPDTDPFVVEVGRYHRQEEARHVAFARTILPLDWAAAGALDRLAVRHAVPLLLAYTFALLVHPGVYASVGLPPWSTWWAANTSPRRRALRQDALRPVLRTLLGAGVLRRGRVPRGWRWLCGVDRHGEPS